MSTKSILVIAPHPDDETISLGGSIAKLSSQGHQVHILTVCGHLPPLYTKQDYYKTVTEAEKAYEIIGASSSEFLSIPATTVSTMPIHELNNKIYNSIEKIKPKIVFCPYPDRNIDIV